MRPGRLVFICCHEYICRFRTKRSVEEKSGSKSSTIMHSLTHTYNLRSSSYEAANSKKLEALQLGGEEGLLRAPLKVLSDPSMKG